MDIKSAGNWYKYQCFAIFWRNIRLVQIQENLNQNRCHTNLEQDSSLKPGTEEQQKKTVLNDPGYGVYDILRIYGVQISVENIGQLLIILDNLSSENINWVQLCFI